MRRESSPFYVLKTKMYILFPSIFLIVIYYHRCWKAKHIHITIFPRSIFSQDILTLCVVNFKWFQGFFFITNLKKCQIKTSKFFSLISVINPPLLLKQIFLSQSSILLSSTSVG